VCLGTIRFSTDDAMIPRRLERAPRCSGNKEFGLPEQRGARSSLLFGQVTSVNWQPKPLTDREDAALRPWRLGCIVAMVLIGSSYIGIVLYMCLAENPNLWLLGGWIAANSIAWRFGLRFANGRFDWIIESVTEEDSNASSP
jgi:hypothetical protein